MGPQRLLYPAKGGDTRSGLHMWHCWAIFPVCYNGAPTQVLAAPERGWVRRRWDSFFLEGWIEEAPSLRFPDMTGQGHTEASSQERGEGLVLSCRLSYVWEALAPSLPVPS